MKQTIITLNDAYKSFTLDQDKVIAPEETVKRLKQRLATIQADILKETIRIDNGRLDIPVYFSTCGSDALSVIGTRKQMGKGATPAQSEASAVMELSERYSFFSFCKNPDNFIIAKQKEITENTLPFEMIAKSVHDESENLEAAQKIFQDLPMRWTWAFNLTRNEPVMIPFDWFYAINEYNGPSAGNCQEEALIQGICEIVERHVSSLISRNAIRVPAIDPNSPKDQMVVEMIGKYHNAGVQLYLSDFSLDTGIPSVGALAYDPSTFPEKSEIVWTAGTTPNPEKALSRALTEVAQLAGDFNTGSNYVASGLPKFTEIQQADFIIHADQTLPIQALPDLSDPNMKTEVQNLIHALEARGFEVIVIDTKNDLLDIPAFYTIIPGAHFRERAIGTSVGMFSARLLTENYPPQMALMALETMDKILPNTYYVKFHMGSCYNALNDFETALNLYRQALDLQPNTEDMVSIYSYMGQCYKNMEKYTDAIRVLEKGAAMDADRTDIYNLMGFCYFKRKEHEKAIDCFKKVIALDPGSAIDYANIASNYRDMGQKEKAIEFYQTALMIDPTIEFARENLKNLLTDS